MSLMPRNPVSFSLDQYTTTDAKCAQIVFNVHKLIGRLKTKIAECDYLKYDQKLTEHLTHWLDDESRISEISREVSALEDINDATNERVMIMVQRVEAQRVQKEALDSMKEAKEFDSIRFNMQRQDNESHKKQEVGGKL